MSKFSLKDIVEIVDKREINYCMLLKDFKSNEHYFDNSLDYIWLCNVASGYL